jgi:hypothetical protein
MKMNPAQAWKNFNLGEELSVSGTFIYNGLRRFHEIRQLDHSDEIFETLYNLSVGLERLLKIAVVLLEHEEDGDIAALEESMITHNHLELLHRVRQKAEVNLGSPHNDFLSLLSTFYKTLRYDRFSISSVYDPHKERSALRAFLEKHLKIRLEDASSIFGTQKESRYSEYLRRLVTKISGALYELIRERASALNLFTYELRHGSKAETVFLGKADLPSEEVLWKELLIFFMNSRSDNGALGYMRGIEPLDFDPALAQDYLECFQSDAAKGMVMDELEHHYSELNNVGERLQMMSLIGDPRVDFDPPEFNEDPEQ